MPIENEWYSKTKTLALVFFNPIGNRKCRYHIFRVGIQFILSKLSIMKKQSKLIAIGATCVLFLFSCNREEITKVEDAESTEESVSSMSGEELFREIVLMQGDDVSERIPQYAKHVSAMNHQPEEVIKVRNESCDEIIAQISLMDPNYFSHFESVILADNPYEIQRELNNATKVLESTITLISGEDKFISEASKIAQRIALKYDFSDDEQVEVFKADILETLQMEFPEMNLGDNYDVGRCVALVNIVAIVHVSVAVLVHAAFWFWGTEMERSDSTLEQDQIIATIIENY